MTQRLSAYVIASPVTERIPSRGTRATVIATGLTTAFVDIDGFIVAISTREVPLMPNAISIVENAGTAAFQKGESVGVSGSLIEGAEVSVALGFGDVWDPAIGPARGYTRTEVARRGRGLLRACRIPPSTGAESMARAIVDSGVYPASDEGDEEGIDELMKAVAGRDSDAARRAGRLLVGRGRQPAPEGDFLLAATAIGMLTFGGTTGFDDAERNRWIDGLGLLTARDHTTPLAATLLELAARGMAAEPVHHLLNLAVTPERWRPALHRLLGFGFWAGRAFATGAGATAALLGSDPAA